MSIASADVYYEMLHCVPKLIRLLLRYQKEDCTFRLISAALCGPLRILMASRSTNFRAGPRRTLKFGKSIFIDQEREVDDLLEPLIGAESRMTQLKEFLSVKAQTDDLRISNKTHNEVKFVRQTQHETREQVRLVDSKVQVLDQKVELVDCKVGSIDQNVRSMNAAARSLEDKTAALDSKLDSKLDSLGGRIFMVETQIASLADLWRAKIGQRHQEYQDRVWHAERNVGICRYIDGQVQGTQDASNEPCKWAVVLDAILSGLRD